MIRNIEMRFECVPNAVRHLRCRAVEGEVSGIATIAQTTLAVDEDPADRGIGRSAEFEQIDARRVLGDDLEAQAVIEAHLIASKKASGVGCGCRGAGPAHCPGPCIDISLLRTEGVVLDKYPIAHVPRFEAVEEG